MPTTIRPNTWPTPLAGPDVEADWGADPADIELIDDLIIDWRSPRGTAVSERYKTNARRTLVAFAGWLAARDTTLCAATKADCNAWLTARATLVKPHTQVTSWSHLKGFYRLAQHDDVARPLGERVSPMARIPQPHAPKYVRTKGARLGEFERLLEAFDRRTTIGLRNATMCSLMFRSGLRVGELAPLDYPFHIDVEARHLLIEDPKNDEPRRPPIHPETLALLRRYLRRRGERSGPLFLNEGPRQRAVRMRTASIQTMFKRAAGRTGVALTPHTLRRGGWAEYVEHGGDVVTGMHIWGWASEEMPYRYLADRRDEASQVVFDEVAARQVTARRRRLRAV